MTKRELELIEKEILTEEELKELTEVNEYEDLGASGHSIGCRWYVIKEEDGEEHSVYVKY